MMQLDPQTRRPHTKTIFGSTLNKIEPRFNRKLFRSGNWDVIVLQGQEISVSGKYKYSTEESIKIASDALESGTRVIWFAEWAWQAETDPTERIHNVYKAIQRQVDGPTTIAPIGLAWRAFHQSSPQRNLLSADGNHANPAGAYLSALVLYQVITGRDCQQLSTVRLNGISADLQRRLQRVASTTVAQFQAMQRVLQADQKLGANRNTQCKTDSLGTTIENYVREMKQVNLDDCPPRFKTALLKHLDAWKQSIDFFNSHNQLRGEMHDLFNQIRQVDDSEAQQLKQAEDEIWSTWSEVEAAALSIDLKVKRG